MVAARDLDVVGRRAGPFAELAEIEPDDVLGSTTCAHGAPLDLDLRVALSTAAGEPLEFRLQPRLCVGNAGSQPEHGPLQLAQPIVLARVEFHDAAVLLDQRDGRQEALALQPAAVKVGWAGDWRSRPG